MFLTHLKSLKSTTWLRRFKRNEYWKINSAWKEHDNLYDGSVQQRRGARRLVEVEGDMKFETKPSSSGDKYQEGRQYEGFECFRCENVPDFGIMSYNFRHLKTGTELWYVDRADANKVFSINFRTTPFDSTGLPHILEHCVLCGSEKYPVRDPFFKMLNRSVATFMNAMTGADYTLYPFSTMNPIDYQNLQKIYLDAVFR